MDLSTTYCGLALPHPFVAGASVLSDTVDGVVRLAEAGAAAVVLPSLFEEQLRQEQLATVHEMEVHGEGFAEALSFFPDPPDMTLGAEPYLEKLSAAAAAVDVPVIASLNGMTDAGWLDHARQLETAGAAALELNIYFVATDPEETGQAVDDRVLGIARRVKGAVGIPVAVKLSPYYSSVANLAARLDGVGVDGLVLFNRFFQPTIDIEELEVVSHLRLSDPSELPLRLAWLGILHGRVRVSMAVTGGVHGVEDAVKAIMSGADAIQTVSALLRNGPSHLATLRDGLAAWLEEREYRSLAQMKGSMSLARCPDPAAYQRHNYMRLLQEWRA
ncbi:MAG: dihydroorotate dehydrogenase-like protein [Deinococcus-Thermus bacterium]|jgi:dihydroorotate dehydrogenase (fumarate)|nr:dihydroorotate dehydrogenase-like protein [Deinococcota bacterium]